MTLTKEQKTDILTFAHSRNVKAKISFSGDKIIIVKSMIMADGFRIIMNYLDMHFSFHTTEWSKPRAGKQKVTRFLKSAKNNML